MGFLKDMRSLQKTAKDLTPPEHRGVMGGFRAIKDTAAMGAQQLSTMQETAQLANRLATDGRTGTALVTALRDTGVTVNEDPQVEMDLQVTIEGVAPYNATCTQVVHRLAVPSVQPGQTVPVKVDPNDLQKLIVA